MKKEYDLTNAVRGKFYRGNRPFQIRINYDAPDRKARFEIFVDDHGKYRFRLKTSHGVLITSDEFRTKKACQVAIEQLRENSLVASTVEV
jgi:uncharacterized protein YegP (UPF0339 family)